MVRGTLVLLGVASVLLSPDALAYCRTTNCSCSSAATCAQDCPKDANGCPSTGVPVAWSGGCAGFSLDVAGTEELTADQWTSAIVQAFDAWTGVDCGGGNPPSFDLLQLRDVACGQAQYNQNGPNANVVFFSDDGWNGANIDGTLALTTVTFSDSGQILDADMAVNSARHDFTVGDQGVQTDLVSIITHEVGHFLGIAHSQFPNAVMYYEYTPGTIKRDLTTDDIAAVCTIYPPGPRKACDPTPQGGLASTCSSSPKQGCSAAGSDRTSDNGQRGGILLVLMAVAGVIARAVLRQRSLR